MKYKIWAILALMMTLLAACANAQQLPSIGCFSPGLSRLRETENPTVSIDAELTVENAMYVRNLSVLRTMLDGMTLHYEGDAATDALTISRNGETLMQAAMTRDGQGARVLLDGETYAVATPDEAEIDWPEPLAQTPIWERIPLTGIAPWLEGLKAGDALGFGATAAGAFDVARTMSDDGERLTKLDIRGAVEIAGETWQVSGFLRQPGGKAPKDTFELTAAKDDNTFLNLSYSATRKDEIEQKNRKGRTSVAATLKATGKLNGYAVSTVLKVSQKNDWTADGGKLSEKITVSVNMTHKDNTPGKRMQRLNQVDIEGKNVIRIVTTEDEMQHNALTDEATVKVMMDGNTFLSGGAALDVRFGGEAPEAVSAETAGDETALSEALERAVQNLSRRVYRQLDANTQKAIGDGL